MQKIFFSESMNKLLTKEKEPDWQLIIHRQKLLQDSESMTSQF